MHRAIVTHLCNNGSGVCQDMHFTDDCECTFTVKDFGNVEAAKAFAGPNGDVFEVDGVLTKWGTKPAIPRTRDGKISYRKPRILRKGETVNLSQLANA